MKINALERPYILEYYSAWKIIVEMNWLRARSGWRINNSSEVRMRGPKERQKEEQSLPKANFVY